MTAESCFESAWEHRSLRQNQVSYRDEFVSEEAALTYPEGYIGVQYDIPCNPEYQRVPRLDSHFLHVR